MYAAGKIFGKIYLKAIRDTLFYQYVVCDQDRDKETRFFGGGDIQQKEKIQTFGSSGSPTYCSFS